MVQVFEIQPSPCTRHILHNCHSHFKKIEPQKITQNLNLKGRTAIICKADEQGSFVQNKRQQHWLWYAVDSVTRKVIAHVFGPRTDATLRRLLGLLTGFDIKFVCTDDWGSYAREIPDVIHLVGKIFTQRIERHNLNLRTHIKRLASTRESSFETPLGQWRLSDEQRYHQREHRSRIIDAE